MKFSVLCLPTVPATMAQRRAQRPISAKTEYFQNMLKEVVELARAAEDVGIEGICFTEHHLNDDGLEAGSTPSFQLYTALNTKHIKVGVIGYVLPGWNPLRLAVETGWLDQMTKGRTFIGLARGYQTRWLNAMAQRLHVGAAASDQSEMDKTNRRVFEETFRILKLAWKDEPFSFKGEFWEYPYPYEEGTPWPAARYSAEFGAPDTIDVESGRVRKINVVPKPYQKPHPQLFQAFSVSDETIRWCAKEDLIPMTLVPQPQMFRRLIDMYKEESDKAGRNYALGQNFGTFRTAYVCRDRQEGLKMVENGFGTIFINFWGEFGFFEAFREPSDEGRFKKLPPSEWSAERLVRSKFALIGNETELRKEFDALVENGNPEHFCLGLDQGLIPTGEIKDQIVKLGKIFKHYM